MAGAQVPTKRLTKKEMLLRTGPEEAPVGDHFAEVVDVAAGVSAGGDGEMPVKK